MGEMRKQLCTFRVDNLLCGIEVERVQEVVRYREMTTVPLSPPEVLGLINLRGQIVTAIDLRRRMGLEDRTDGKPPMNIVARGNDGLISLQVDEILDVLDIDENACEGPPEPLDPFIKTLVKKVYKLETGLLMVLDADKVFDVTEGADVV